MAKNKRKRTNLLSVPIRDDKSSNVEVKQDTQELQAWCDLPAELLELILSHLTLRENIRFSAVCKRWHSIAISVRQMNQPPWLMYIPKSGNVYEFYDPLCRKIYSMELEELAGSEVFYTKAGWLLSGNLNSGRFFIFNPFTKELINLPTSEMTWDIVAFSCDPKSSSCVVFSLKPVTGRVVAIGTCHPGATEWTIAYYHNPMPVGCSKWYKVVFSHGQFYCVNSTGWLGVFDLEELTWDMLVMPRPRCLYSDFTSILWKGNFLAEHDGNILLIYICGGDNLLIFKLDQENLVWEEVKTLDGITLFVSFHASPSRTDLPGVMRNSIYFPKFRFFGKRCISYSLKDSRYYPRNESHDWEKLDPSESIWIDSPQDHSLLM